MTTVATINQSGLRAGTLPLTPIYANWQDAYTYLKRTVILLFQLSVIPTLFFLLFKNQLKRGSGLFNRAVLGGTSVLSAPGTPIANA